MADLGSRKPADELANDAALHADVAVRTMNDAEGEDFRDRAFEELGMAVTSLGMAVRELSRDVRRLKG